MSQEQARILIVGMGGVGTMAACALKTEGRARVTAVLRSNYAVVEEKGFGIDSNQYGRDIRQLRTAQNPGLKKQVNSLSSTYTPGRTCHSPDYVVKSARGGANPLRLCPRHNQDGPPGSSIRQTSLSRP